MISRRRAASPHALSPFDRAPEPRTLHDAKPALAATRALAAPMRTLAARVALAVVVTFAPAVAALLLLHPEGPPAAIYVYCAIALLLAGAASAGRDAPAAVGRTALANAAARGAAPKGRAASALLAVWLSFGAFIVFAGLDITPASTIVAWIAVAHGGAASGVISYLFAAIIALFSSLFGCLLLRGADPIGTLLKGLVVALFLAGIITGRPLLMAAAPLAVGIAFAYRASRGAGRSHAGLRRSLQLFAVALGIAALLYLTKPENPLFEAPFALDLKPLVARLFPSFPFLYGLPGYGYSFPGESFGDRPALTKRPVFDVAARPGETLYLRTAAYDTYTGAGWQASEALQQAGREEAERLAERSSGSRTLIGPGGSTAPGRRVGPGRGASTSVPVARVTLLVDFFPALPSTLETGGFTVERALPIDSITSSPGRGLPAPTGSLPDEDLSGKLELSEAGLATGFLLKTPLLAGSVITIERAAPPAAVSPAGTAVASTAAAAANSTAGTASAGAAARSTASAAYPGSAFGPDLPDAATDLEVAKPPRELVQLARELSRGRSKEETIEAIKLYLADRCSYSLESPGPPVGGDMVTTFLFTTRRGYCVQFATSMVILARLAGIPARYVTGFLVNIPESSPRAIVTGMSAHAWAEVWLDGRWRTVEATPPMEPSSFGDPDYYRRFDPSGDSYTRRQLETAMQGRVAAPAEARSPAKGLPSALLAIPAIAALLAACALAARSLLLALQPVPAKARRRIRRLLDLSSRRALPDPARWGWRAWIAETAPVLDRWKALRRSHVERAGRIILFISFGQRRASRRDLRLLTALCRHIARLPKTTAEWRPFTSSGPLVRVNPGSNAKLT